MTTKASPASTTSEAGPPPDPWTDLRAFTPARLALGRSGHSLPTAELLRFGVAHAQARDAVQLPLDVPALDAALRAQGIDTLQVRSAAPDRATYLVRPDLGRRLDADSAQCLRERAARPPAGGADLLLVVGDGLSSFGVQRSAAQLVAHIVMQAAPGWAIGPVVIATQARVALGDEIGDLLGARFVAMLIGERPGLSSPDSLGIYLTAAPKIGRLASQRNCISNIRDAGLAPAEAARTLWRLCAEARRLGATGIRLPPAAPVLGSG